jgi:hypothetical protein
VVSTSMDGSWEATIETPGLLYIERGSKSGTNRIGRLRYSLPRNGSLSGMELICFNL